LCCKQGEEQKKLDVVTNDVIKRALKFTGKVGVIASEEEDAPVFNKDAYRYLHAYFLLPCLVIPRNASWPMWALLLQLVRCSRYRALPSSEFGLHAASFGFIQSDSP
jgi:hypothetical protein